MRHKSPFKQFAKDCPEHFEKEVLLHASLKESNPFNYTKKEKSTRNSKIRNKF